MAYGDFTRSFAPETPVFGPETTLLHKAREGFIS
jgi:hypothetical protein